MNSMKSLPKTGKNSPEQPTAENRVEFARLLEKATENQVVNIMGDLSLNSSEGHARGAGRKSGDWWPWQMIIADFEYTRRNLDYAWLAHKKFHRAFEYKWKDDQPLGWVSMGTKLSEVENPKSDGNSAKHHTGKRCAESDCHNIAGTVWSHLWCYECNVKRMKRIGKSLEKMTGDEVWADSA